MNIAESLQPWAAKLDAMSLRERALLFACAVAAVIMLLQLLLIEPALSARGKMQGQLRALDKNVLQQQLQIQVLEAELARGVNRDRERQRDQMRGELKALQTRIDESVVAMIPPQLMAQVLESVLSQEQSLRLLSLENQPVKALLLQAAGEQQAGSQAAKPDDEAPQGLYEHRFVLRLQGSYAATIRYFEKLAALPWQFHWDSLRYEVQHYPEAIISLEVHTVSLSEDWIGV